jgi:hypothetical protein
LIRGELLKNPFRPKPDGSSDIRIYLIIGIYRRHKGKPMKKFSPTTVVAIICLAFSFAGLIVLSVAFANMRTAFILILAWYLAAIGIFCWRERRYRTHR